MTAMGEINPQGTGTIPGSATQGFAYKEVIIKEVPATGLAVCEDSLGRRMEIPVSYRRAKGALPKVGEVWVADRALGYWTFACVIRDAPPVITGSTAGNTAMRSLLNQLAAAGLITDATTDS